VIPALITIINTSYQGEAIFANDGILKFHLPELSRQHSLSLSAHISPVDTS
jgi:hypothetical protein